MGWVQNFVVLKVGTSLMDIAAVQEVGEHWWWEQE